MEGCIVDIMMLRNMECLVLQYFATTSFLLLLNSRTSNCLHLYTEYAEGHLLSLCDLKLPFIGLSLSV